MNTIELFCGTKSFSKVFQEKGHTIFTIDNNQEFKPTMCNSILDIKRSQLPKKINVLWASPPCTCFSVASIGSSWCGNYCPKKLGTALGMAFVLKTLELIKEIQKDNPDLIYFIENPRGVLRKMAFMEGLTRYSVTYCQYGDSRMKPTDIWTNCKTWKPRPMCKNGMPCHTPAPRGAKTGTQGLKGNKERSIIPPDLIKEILEAVENERQN